MASATAVQHHNATACDSQTPQHATTDQDIENKENLNKDVAASVAMPQQDATARDSQTPQRATLQNMAAPQPKKRGLFGRVLNAVFNDDE